MIYKTKELKFTAAVTKLRYGQWTLSEPQMKPMFTGPKTKIP